MSLKLYCFFSEEEFNDLQKNSWIVRDTEKLLYTSIDAHKRRKKAYLRKYAGVLLLNLYKSAEFKKVANGVCKIISEKPIIINEYDIYEYSYKRYKHWKDKAEDEYNYEEPTTEELIEILRSKQDTVWFRKRWNKYYAQQYKTWIGYWDGSGDILVNRGCNPDGTTHEELREIAREEWYASSRLSEDVDDSVRKWAREIFSSDDEDFEKNSGFSIVYR